MKKERIRHYAHLIAGHADSPWATSVFFWVFFLDSIILVIPIDSIMSAALTIKPQHYKKWLFAAVMGFASGLLAMTFIAYSHFQPYLFSWIKHLGYTQELQSIIDHAQAYGYWELTIACLTVLPPLFGVIIGVLVKLNPFAVWFISMGGKMIKLGLMVWLAVSSSTKVRKWVNLYLKTSI